jgi:Flp pilus assembly protein TadD
MGDLLRRDEKFIDAIAAYDKAVEIYGKDGEKNWALFYTRGIALERAKQWDRAEADFKRALEINPEHPDVLNYLGYSWLDRGENLAEARSLIELAYAKSPDNGYIVDSLGWAMYLAGDYQGAVEKLERAVELRPGDATLNDHLGDAYWKVGRRNEARFQWSHALTLDPDDKQKISLKTKLEQGLASN